MTVGPWPLGDMQGNSHCMKKHVAIILSSSHGEKFAILQVRNLKVVREGCERII